MQLSPDRTLRTLHRTLPDIPDIPDMLFRTVSDTESDTYRTVIGQSSDSIGHRSDSSMLPYVQNVQSETGQPGHSPDSSGQHRTVMHNSQACHRHAPEP